MAPNGAKLVDQHQPAIKPFMNLFSSPLTGTGGYCIQSKTKSNFGVITLVGKAMSILCTGAMIAMSRNAVILLIEANHTEACGNSIGVHTLLLFTLLSG